jgi:hypothetical protein
VYILPLRKSPKAQKQQKTPKKLKIASFFLNAVIAKVSEFTSNRKNVKMNNINQINHK